MLNKTEITERIVGGDFNLVLDLLIDQINRKSNNDKSAEVVNTYCEEAMLIDIWRRHNPEQRRYTCFQKRCRTYARLDYMFVSYSMLPTVSRVDILPVYKSDHSPVLTKIIPASKEK